MILIRDILKLEHIAIRKKYLGERFQGLKPVSSLLTCITVKCEGIRKIPLSVYIEKCISYFVDYKIMSNLYRDF